MFYLYHINSLIYLEIKDGMSFGRTTGSKTFTEDSRMSGEHCKFHVIKDELYVEDLNSKNRTILDRIELVPGKKIQMKFESLLEVGDQRFILTDRNLRIEDINDIISSHSGDILKLEGAKLLQELNDRIQSEITQMNTNEAALTAQVTEKKVRISDAQKAVINLAKEAETQLQELQNQVQQIEEKKAEVRKSIAAREDKFHEEIAGHTKDIQVLLNQISKIREEIGIKKKKLKKG